MKKIRPFSGHSSFHNVSKSTPQSITVDKNMQKSLRFINFKELIWSVSSQSQTSIAAIAQSIKEELVPSRVSRLSPVTRPSQQLVFYGSVRVSNLQCLSVASVSFCLNGTGVEEVYSYQSNKKVSFCRESFPITINLAREESRLWHRVSSKDPLDLLHLYISPSRKDTVSYMVKVLQLPASYVGDWHNHKKDIYFEKDKIYERSPDTFLHQINHFESKSLKAPSIDSISKSLFWPQ